MPGYPIRLLIVDRRPIIRWALLHLLSRYAVTVDGFDEVTTVAEAREALMARKYDVTILCKPLDFEDFRDMEKLEADIFTHNMVGFFERQDWIEVEAFLLAGGCACVCSEGPVEEFLTAVKAAASGRRWISPMLRDINISNEQKSTESQLSDREIEIVAHLARGLTNKQTAQKLCISLRTVETHRNRIYRKLNMNTRAQLVAYALNNDLI